MPAGQRAANSPVALSVADKLDTFRGRLAGRHLLQEAIRIDMDSFTLWFSQHFHLRNSLKCVSFSTTKLDWLCPLNSFW